MFLVNSKLNSSIEERIKNKCSKKAMSATKDNLFLNLVLPMLADVASSPSFTAVTRATERLVLGRVAPS